MTKKEQLKKQIRAMLGVYENCHRITIVDRTTEPPTKEVAKMDEDSRKALKEDITIEIINNRNQVEL